MFYWIFSLLHLLIQGRREILEARLLPWDRNIKKNNCDFLSQTFLIYFKISRLHFIIQLFLCLAPPFNKIY